VYARFLVAHLADWEGAVGGWAAQLAPGGRLLLEEVEAIDTAHPVLADYLACLRADLAGRGHRLEAGPLLARVAARSRVSSAEPAAGRAAAMFRMNLDAWCRDQAVHDRLAPGLEALLDDDRTGVITWRLRQAVLEARPG
jgi:hypothetical protein